MVKKKVTVTLIVAALLMGLLGGCGSPAVSTETSAPANTSAEVQTTDEEHITIDFMNFSANEGGQVALDMVKAMYEKEHPNVTINIETFDNEPYFTQLQTRLGGNDAPDCFELQLGDVPSYVEQDVILPLTDMVANTTTDLSVLTQKSRDAFSMNGITYGLPYSYSTVVMIYNKDLFDQAGISYPTNDWTWADADAAAEKIKALGPDYYGLIQPISTYEFFKVVKQYGGSLLNEDNTAFTVNSPENVEALQRLCDNILVSNICPSAEQRGSLDEWGQFKLGKTGMIVTGIWAFPSFTTDCDFNWDICVEPGATQKATHYFANGIFVSKDSEHAQAAYDWIEYLSTSERMSQARVQLGWELPCANYQSVMDLYMETTPPDNKAAVFDSLEYVVSQPMIVGFSQMCSILDVELQAAAAGAKTPQQALDDAQAQLESAIPLQ